MSDPKLKNQLLQFIAQKLLIQLGVTALLIAGLVFLIIYYVNSSGDVLKTVAESFKSGKVVTEFHDYITRIEGSNRLQVATLHSVDTFTKKDSRSIFWDLVKFPDVVVEFKAPIEYTYFISLKGDWSFSWDENAKGITVIAPQIEPGTPAIDISKMEIYEKQGSIFRDSEKVKQQLKSELSGKLTWAANEKIPLIRETARKQISEFIQEWFIRYYFKDSAIKPERIDILFPGESPALKEFVPDGIEER